VTKLEIYVRMNTLLYGASISGLLGQSASPSILKSSGTQTPAPASKVLRWKDLEAAAMEDQVQEIEGLSTRSIFATQERQDVLTMGDSWDNEGDYLEELFV
jgi:hypothetical protein